VYLERRGEPVAFDQGRVDASPGRAVHWTLSRPHSGLDCVPVRSQQGDRQGLGAFLQIYTHRIAGADSS
jgi:hypothetical protein